MSNLSKAAEDALLAADGSRKIVAPVKIIAELRGQEYVGPELGLTRSGRIKRDRIMDQRLDEAFGG